MKDRHRKALRRESNFEPPRPSCCQATVHQCTTKHPLPVGILCKKKSTLMPWTLEFFVKTKCLNAFSHIFIIINPIYTKQNANESGDYILLLCIHGDTWMCLLLCCHLSCSHHICVYIRDFCRYTLAVVCQPSC